MWRKEEECEEERSLWRRGMMRSGGYKLEEEEWDMKWRREIEKGQGEERETERVGKRGVEGERKRRRRGRRGRGRGFKTH